MSQQSAAAILEPVLNDLFRETIPIRIALWDGSTLGPATKTSIVIHSPDALLRMAWAPGELGLARAYVAGDIQVNGDIFELLAVRNLLREPTGSVGFRPRELPGLWRAARALGIVKLPPPPPSIESHLRGPQHLRRRDAQAIAHHYDVGNDFYRLVLGPTLTYSCAYWTNHDSTLQEAQNAKYDLICRKLALTPGMRLLDVGCGWGGMTLHAAQHYEVHAVGITLSNEQAILARERIEAAGLANKIEIRVQDYRDIHDGPFDAISSIGMFEHVGLARASEYFADLYQLLKPGARLLNHAISQPDPTHAAIAPRSFMARYVFPDAALIEVGTAISAMQAQGLEVRDVESLREHYPKTLRAWVKNLEDNWETAQQLVGPARARVWRLYMAGSALAFEANRIAIHQVLAVHTHDSGRSQFRPTRDWLTSEKSETHPNGH